MIADKNLTKSSEKNAINQNHKVGSELAVIICSTRTFYSMERKLYQT